MSDIFSGLESMGLKNLENVDIFHDPKKKAEVKKEEKKEPEKKLEEKDFIFEKSVECVCCGNNFTERIIRPGKVKAVGQDVDLRPKYKDFDVLKYGITACPVCGYATISKNFSNLSQTQSKWIKEKISMFFTGLHYDTPIYTYDDAIARYKLALVNSVVKHGKTGEKAYICLYLGWLTRGKAERLAKDIPDREKVLSQLADEENDYLKKAAEGFGEAIMKENFPIQGLDETTMFYLLCALNYEIGKYSDSLKYCEKIISNRSISDRIRDRAREIKESIKEIRESQ